MFGMTFGIIATAASYRITLRTNRWLRCCVFVSTCFLFTSLWPAAVKGQVPVNPNQNAADANAEEE